MKLEYVNLDAMPKLNRPTKLQAVLDEFMASGEKAARCVFNKGEYANPSSAQKSYKVAISRLKYPIIARTVNGVLYLIKISPDEMGSPK